MLLVLLLLRADGALVHAARAHFRLRSRVTVQLSVGLSLCRVVILHLGSDVLIVEDVENMKLIIPDHVQHDTREAESQLVLFTPRRSCGSSRQVDLA